MSALLALFGRMRVWAVGVAAAAAVLLAALWRAREEGKAAAAAEQAKARQRLQERYDEIDETPGDVGGAYDRLRRMSDGRR
jgi:FtsZ-interacting cell division protein ZipA